MITAFSRLQPIIPLIFKNSGLRVRSAGVTLNQVFPDWLLVILLSIMLVLLSIRTLQSGIRLHRKEVASRKEGEEDSDTQASRSIVLVGVNVSIDTHVSHLNIRGGDVQTTAQLTGQSMCSTGGCAEFPGTGRLRCLAKDQLII